MIFPMKLFWWKLILQGLRMLMYATIYKSVKNIDRTIRKMIIVGFIGQLQGWWDNYLSMEEKASIINAVATDDSVDNLEHFNGTFTNQHETVRTLLNGLRCQTLGHFRWYKDTFFSRFIDDLPPLFAERVSKVLRGNYGEIPYKDYTYGKIIGTCT
ncbi:hypothetical protein H5410_050047 [Solanum commersonii]|uniref:DUF7746 domain-containing protein n=1 Tax=Solanum commersonii TaxID=4109 RepID=A0A9J5WWG8_SOLCO|nr:hypothetical protein H5410_050047 [Solanum commersonii]